ncbi:hypothetical protein D918_06166 [Trichuris suis]|nr:hypothetical protein D918_06166 [Trichuris suis]
MKNTLADETPFGYVQVIAWCYHSLSKHVRSYSIERPLFRKKRKKQFNGRTKSESSKVGENEQKREYIVRWFVVTGKECNVWITVNSGEWQMVYYEKGAWFRPAVGVTD